MRRLHDATGLQHRDHYAEKQLAHGHVVCVGHARAGKAPRHRVKNACCASTMSSELRTAKEAAKHLGIAVTTFYEWLGKSDCGLLLIRGQPLSVRYYQGGRSGQGKIQVEATEIERIRELMRVVPHRPMPRGPQLHRDQYPGITVPLGCPTE